MNRFIIILISLFLFSTPAFSVDVIDACPDRFKYEQKENDSSLLLTEQWKALSQNEKNYCACLGQKEPKYYSITGYCSGKWLSSDNKTKTTSKKTIVVLIVVSVFILFVFRKPIGKIINRKTSNKKEKKNKKP